MRGQMFSINSGTQGPQHSMGDFPSNPNEQLGFEINPIGVDWSFAPEFYPDDFTQMKKKELTRYGGNCGGESVSIKTIKNREFHVSGVVLHGNIGKFQGLLDHTSEVDILSPLTPNGGMECFVKQGELGKQQGWDPQTRQWMFKFTLDLVSTGRDEHDTGENAIVTAILDDSDEASPNPECTYEGHPRSEYIYNGPDSYQDTFEEWQQCEMTTSDFSTSTPPGGGTDSLELDN